VDHGFELQEKNRLKVLEHELLYKSFEKKVAEERKKKEAAQKKKAEEKEKQEAAFPEEKQKQQKGRTFKAVLKEFGHTCGSTKLTNRGWSHYGRQKTGRWHWGAMNFESQDMYDPPPTTSRLDTVDDEYSQLITLWEPQLDLANVRRIQYTKQFENFKNENFKNDNAIKAYALRKLDVMKQGFYHIFFDGKIRRIDCQPESGPEECEYQTVSQFGPTNPFQQGSYYKFDPSKDDLRKNKDIMASFKVSIESACAKLAWSNSQCAKPKNSQSKAAFAVGEYPNEMEDVRPSYSGGALADGPVDSKRKWVCVCPRVNSRNTQCALEDAQKRATNAWLKEPCPFDPTSKIITTKEFQVGDRCGFYNDRAGKEQQGEITAVHSDNSVNVQLDGTLCRNMKDKRRMKQNQHNGQTLKERELAFEQERGMYEKPAQGSNVEGSEEEAVEEEEEDNRGNWRSSCRYDQKGMLYHVKKDTSGYSFNLPQKTHKIKLYHVKKVGPPPKQKGDFECPINQVGPYRQKKRVAWTTYEYSIPHGMVPLLMLPNAIKQRAQPRGKYTVDLGTIDFLAFGKSTARACVLLAESTGACSGDWETSCVTRTIVSGKWYDIEEPGSFDWSSLNFISPPDRTFRKGSTFKAFAFEKDKQRPSCFDTESNRGSGYNHGSYVFSFDNVKSVAECAELCWKEKVKYENNKLPRNSVGKKKLKHVSGSWVPNQPCNRISVGYDKWSKLICMIYDPSRTFANRRNVNGLSLTGDFYDHPETCPTNQSLPLNHSIIDVPVERFYDHVGWSTAHDTLDIKGIIPSKLEYYTLGGETQIDLHSKASVVQRTDDKVGLQCQDDGNYIVSLDLATGKCTCPAKRVVTKESRSVADEPCPTCEIYTSQHCWETGACDTPTNPQCASDEYEKEPPSTTTDRVCVKISEPCWFRTFNNGSTNGTNGRTDQNLWEYAEPSLTSDRVCLPVTRCTEDQYEQEPPTPTKDTVCAQRTVCDGYGSFGEYGKIPTMDTFGVAMPPLLDRHEPNYFASVHRCFDEKLKNQQQKNLDEKFYKCLESSGYHPDRNPIIPSNCFDDNVFLQKIPHMRSDFEYCLRHRFHRAAGELEVLVRNISNGYHDEFLGGDFVSIREAALQLKHGVFSCRLTDRKLYECYRDGPRYSRFLGGVALPEIAVGLQGGLQFSKDEKWRTTDIDWRSKQSKNMQKNNPFFARAFESKTFPYQNNNETWGGKDGKTLRSVHEVQKYLHQTVVNPISLKPIGSVIPRRHGRCNDKAEAMTPARCQAYAKQANIEYIGTWGANKYPSPLIPGISQRDENTSYGCITGYTHPSKMDTTTPYSKKSQTEKMPDDAYFFQAKTQYIAFRVQPAMFGGMTHSADDTAFQLGPECNSKVKCLCNEQTDVQKESQIHARFDSSFDTFKIVDHSVSEYYGEWEDTPGSRDKKDDDASIMVYDPSTNTFKQNAAFNYNPYTSDRTCTFLTTCSVTDSGSRHPVTYETTPPTYTSDRSCSDGTVCEPLGGWEAKFDPFVDFIARNADVKPVFETNDFSLPMLTMEQGRMYQDNANDYIVVNPLGEVYFVNPDDGTLKPNAKKYIDDIDSDNQKWRKTKWPNVQTFVDYQYRRLNRYWRLARIIMPVYDVNPAMIKGLIKMDMSTRNQRGEFETTPMTYYNDRTCKTLTSCGKGTYEFAPPTFTKDRTCNKFTTCSNSEFELAAPTTFADRQCNQLDTCDGYHVTDEPVSKKNVYTYYQKLESRTCLSHVAVPVRQSQNAPTCVVPEHHTLMGYTMSVDACAQKCTATDTCTQFTFARGTEVHNSHKCTHYHPPINTNRHVKCSTDQIDHWSMELYTLVPQLRFSGGNSFELPAHLKAISECASRCKARLGCLYFSYSQFSVLHGDPQKYDLGPQSNVCILGTAKTQLQPNNITCNGDVFKLTVPKRTVGAYHGQWEVSPPLLGSMLPMGENLQGYSRDRVCRDHTRCIVGTHAFTNFETTGHRVYGATTFETTAPTQSSDRICSPTTLCVPHGGFRREATGKHGHEDNIHFPEFTCLSHLDNTMVPVDGTPVDRVQMLTQAKCSDVCQKMDGCQYFARPNDAGANERAECRFTTHAEGKPSAGDCDMSIYRTPPTAFSEENKKWVGEWEVTPADYYTDRICKPLTWCVPGKTYQSKAPTIASDRVCSPVKECSDTEWETRRPDYYHNRECTPLTTCDGFDIRHQPKKGSMGTINGVHQYMHKGHGAYQVAAPVKKYQPLSELSQYILDRKCQTYTVCTCSNTLHAMACAGASGGGFTYQSIPATPTTDRECQPVRKKCNYAAEYESTIATYFHDRICTALNRCNYPQEANALADPGDGPISRATTQFDSSGRLTMADTFKMKTNRICKPVTYCFANQQKFKIQDATKSSDTKCQTFKTCTNIEVETTSPTPTTDRECENRANKKIREVAAAKALATCGAAPDAGGSVGNRGSEAGLSTAATNEAAKATGTTQAKGKTQGFNSFIKKLVCGNMGLSDNEEGCEWGKDCESDTCSHVRGDPIKNVCLPAGGFANGKDCYALSHDQCSSGWCKGSGDDATCTTKIADGDTCNELDNVSCNSGRCTAVRAAYQDDSSVCRPTSNFANGEKCWAGEHDHCSSGWCQGTGDDAHCKAVEDCPSTPKQCGAGNTGTGNVEWDRCKESSGRHLGRIWECAQCWGVAYKRRWVVMTGESGVGTVHGNCDNEKLWKAATKIEKEHTCVVGCCDWNGDMRGMSTRGKDGSKWCGASGSVPTWVPGHYQHQSTCATSGQYYGSGGWDAGSESYCDGPYERGEVFKRTDEYVCHNYPIWEKSGTQCWCNKNSAGTGCA